MSKVIKYNSSKQIDAFNVTQFSPAAPGEQEFVFTRFSPDELSVQDHIAEPKDIVKTPKKSSQAPTYTDTRPSAPRLFAAFEDDGPSYAPPADASRQAAPRLFAAFEDDGPSYAPPAEAARPRLFGSYEPDENEEAMSAKWATNDISATKSGFQEMDLTTNTPKDDLHLPKSQKAIAEQNAAQTALENELASIKSRLEQAVTEKNAAQQKLKEMQDSLESKKETLRQEGYNKAKTEFEAKEQKKYDAERADYMTSVAKSWNEAVTEIRKIDETFKAVDKEMPEIVIAYVREIIGTERKLNDKLITNVIQGALSKLKDLQQILFTVNPDDASAVAEKFPQHGIAIDANIPKGSVKVRTKIGDIDLSINAWIENLEKQINEQLAIAQNNNAQ